MTRNGQIKFYTNLLKDDEILLLKSSDTYFKNHYNLSPVNVLTGFKGTAGEAIINKQGEITLFVDTRYHLLVDKQAFKDINIVKMPLGEKFLDAFKKKFKKNTVLYIENEINLEQYLELDKYFDLRIYNLEKQFLKNGDMDNSKPIFRVEKNVEKNDFLYKVEKYKKFNKKLSKMLLFDLDKISYFTNLRSFQMKYSSNFKSILYFDFINKKYVLFLEKIPKNLDIEGLEFQKLDDFDSFIKSIDFEIAINYKEIPLSKFLLIKKPVSLKTGNLDVLTSIKPKSVIEDMQKSFEKLDLAILNFKKKLKKGLSEVDLVKIFKEELLRQGAIAPSFKTLLALDDNSASIHYSEQDKNKILQNEMIILLDCGAYWQNGFATDITRTFYFGSNPKPVYKKIYSAVLKAFITCFSSKDNVTKNMDKLARNLLKDYENEGFYFNHGLGHGIGTSCHQNPPLISTLSKDTIKPYQTHSIEPGLYSNGKLKIENGKLANVTNNPSSVIVSDREAISLNNDIFGIRIENCVYCDINFNRHSLSKFPFEEVLIDYDMFNSQEISFIKNWNEKWSEFVRK